MQYKLRGIASIKCRISWSNNVMSRFNMNLALLCLWTILAASRGHSMLSSTDTKLTGLELKRQRRSATFYLLDLPKADLPTGCLFYLGCLGPSELKVTQICFIELYQLNVQGLRKTVATTRQPFNLVYNISYVLIGGTQVGRYAMHMLQLIWIFS